MRDLTKFTVKLTKIHIRWEIYKREQLEQAREVAEAKSGKKKKRKKNASPHHSPSPKRNGNGDDGEDNFEIQI